MDEFPSGTAEETAKYETRDGRSCQRRQFLKEAFTVRTCRLILLQYWFSGRGIPQADDKTDIAINPTEKGYI